MNKTQQTFLALALSAQVIQFGDFTLKSGRNSPYFFNMGLFNTGTALSILGRCYAETILEVGFEYDVIFGPAYKGIPLAVATASALSELTGRPVPFCFDRKETKEHGEGGRLIGAPLVGRVLILDDVITAGTAIGKAVDLILSQGASLSGVVVAFDREEKGKTSQSAISEVSHHFNIPVKAIASLSALINFLSGENTNNALLESLTNYQQRYSIKGKEA